MDDNRDLAAEYAVSTDRLKKKKTRASLRAAARLPRLGGRIPRCVAALHGHCDRVGRTGRGWIDHRDCRRLGRRLVCRSPAPGERSCCRTDGHRIRPGAAARSGSSGHRRLDRRRTSVRCGHLWLRPLVPGRVAGSNSRHARGDRHLDFVEPVPCHGRRRAEGERHSEPCFDSRGDPKGTAFARNANRRRAGRETRSTSAVRRLHEQQVQLRERVAEPRPADGRDTSP